MTLMTGSLQKATPVGDRAFAHTSVERDRREPRRRPPEQTAEAQELELEPEDKHCLDDLA